MTDVRDEGTRAQEWRQRIMGLSIKELSELTGYSVTAIRCFEANANTAGELFGDAAWQRYRMACAGILFALDVDSFNWNYHYDKALGGITGKGGNHALKQR